MDSWDTVAIVGVGLIGGSIGLALRERHLARHVVGIGRDPRRLQRAERLGAITSSAANVADGVRHAQLTIVCTPVQTVADFVLQAAREMPPGGVVTDAGSTKARIVREVERQADGAAHYVGSHPLAGSEKNGVQHARSDLFVDRMVIVTPTRRTPRPATTAVARFWSALGAQVREQSPRRHDQEMAAISHAPHVVAAALAAATPPRCLPLAATGWLDTTRVAAGDPQLWEQILNDNRDFVLESLDRVAAVLAKFRQALADDDTRRLTQLLKRGKRQRDAVGS